MSRLANVLTAIKNRTFATTTTATITNGTAGQNKVAKQGDIVTLSLAVNGISSSAAWNNIGTLPSGFRPAQSLEYATFVGGNYGFFGIDTSGNVKVYPTVATSSGILRVVVSYSTV